MSTLNDAIKAEIAKLESDMVGIKTEAAAALAAKLAAVEQDIAAAKQHMTGLVPWLETEVSVAKTAIISFFEKMEGKITPAPAPVAPVAAPVAPVAPVTPAA